ncbi:hypothetical protein MUB24_17685 [Lederbergia sp. NSJ-179]|uniref:hypothetical protein n=1 Tax=Lederbergia sp. NSJ-179 TaxID=2931402 RepID=UPI001FD4C0CF|nr:hypothetical protein [Lederbergia sp. NSJ-179]MCJ7842697.1 hypothetical protein [Lederbergia sp. NSJ-179]
MKNTNKNRTDEKLTSLFKTYPLPKIKETEREEVVKRLLAYMPIEQERTIEVMQKLVWQSFIRIFSHYKIQLIALLLLIFATWTVMPLTIDPWFIFVFTSPVPLFLIGWHLMQAQTDDMVELETTYKYSFQQILFSKVVAVTGWSIVIYSCTLLYMVLIHNVELSMALFHMAVSGLTPILLFSLTLLRLSIKYRNETSWIVIILTWVFFALLSIYTPLGPILLAIHSIIYGIINFALIALLGYQLSHIWRLERLPHEFH